MESTKQTTRSWNEVRMDGREESITSLRSEYDDGSTLETFVAVDDRNEIRRWNVRTYVDGDVIMVETRNAAGELCRTKRIRVADRDRTRKHIEDGATVTSDGVYRWISNGAVIPLDVLEEAGYEITEAHRAARDRDVDEAIAAYRKARASMTDEERAEELAEMRAAFGPGETVVDVLSGERFEL